MYEDSIVVDGTEITVLRDAKQIISVQECPECGGGQISHGGAFGRWHCEACAENFGVDTSPESEIYRPDWSRSG